MTVGERIKELRTKLGLSQVEFADKINVSKQTLYKYENNIITNIPSDKIEEAAKLGNISPSYLMGWDNIDWNLLQKQKQGRKEFVEKWNLQFYEKKIIDIFSQLNDENKKKSISYADNLLSNQKMEEELVAAHQRTDVEYSSEAAKSDLDSMSDENF